jgi:hypothetical protein
MLISLSKPTPRQNGHVSALVTPRGPKRSDFQVILSEANGRLVEMSTSIKYVYASNYSDESDRTS